MNKILLITLLISLVSIFGIKNTVNAQEFKAGIQGGMTATQVTGDALAGFNKAGLFGGLTIRRKMGSFGYGQMEINFIQKGSRKNAKPDKGIYDSYLLRLNYVEVPVSYRYMFMKKMGVDVGLKFAYLINEREFDENGEIPEEAEKPGFNKFDISVFAGLVYKINKDFNFIIRYAYSVKSFRPKPVSSYTHYSDGQFNETICTAFQYNF